MKPDLNQILCKDRHFLKTAFRQPEKFGGIEKVQQKYAKSHEIYQKRRQNLPTPTFDDSLPVHAKRNEIRQAIENNQVVIICGETGSGKTTQIPKICLELGRGAAGLIGHTQPRRLAARSVAERIAEELGSPIGQAVGYKVRFNDQISRDSAIKLMTDGILLAETQTDRFLTAYDTIIIDEAHERSLNIDFLLGYLKQLLPSRPDLKIIITSATIDADRFSQHFNHAPVIEVSGRTFPVEILYRPINTLDEDEAEIEIADAIVDAADELARLGEGDILVFLAGEREIREAAEALRKSPLRKNDDILPLFARLSAQEQHKIFHPTGSQRRIILATNVAETSLTVPRIKYVIDTGLARVKRYSARAKVEQLHVEKISQAAARQRSGRCGRVAAGVAVRLYAENDFNQRPAFTDPEIIRSNLAAVILRMAALKLGDVAAFPFLEAPDQRYINDGFQVLQELGAVNERNELTKLGEQMARLPIDPKISRMLIAAQVHDCVAEMLIIVSALSIQDPRERPLEVREAAAKAHERFADKQSDFLAYVNIWDSFQRERDKGLTNKQLVQWCHQYFLSHLRIREWRELHKQLAEIAVEMGLVAKEHAFRQPENLSVFEKAQIDENADISAQAKQKQIHKKNHLAQIQAKKQSTYEPIHRALLTGLVANVGMKSPEGHDYTGARGSHFHLFPTSALFKSKPKWVMAAELTETSKLYARDVAAIDPEWIEQEARHLVRYHYFEPHWERKRGEVVASERVTLYGLTVLPRRPIAYGKVAPAEARELFIRGALVAQDCDLQAAFFTHNKKLIKEIIDLENKSRKQDVLVDEEVLFDFYDKRLPENYVPSEKSAKLSGSLQSVPSPVLNGGELGWGQNGADKTNAVATENTTPTPALPRQSGEGANRAPKKVSGSLKAKPLADLRTFEAWLKTSDPKSLFLSKEDLMQHAAAHITEEQFPKFWHNADGKFKLSYRFEPHHPLDGVTLTVPLTVLNRINPHELEWLVQGMLREKLSLLIKALPKQIRRVCVPVPDFVTQFLLSEPDQSAPILPQLAHAIAKHAGDMRLLEQINLDEWAAFRLPEHCYFNLRVVDDGGQELASSRDLIQLQQQLGQAAAVTFRDNTQEFERDNITDWTIGTLPESIKFARGKQQLTGYLALQTQKDGTVSLRLFDTALAAEQAHRKGVIKLIQMQLKDHMKDLNKGIQGYTQAAMLLKHIAPDVLKDDLTAAICDRAFIGEDELPRNEKAFKEQIKRAKSRLPAVKEAVSRYLGEITAAYTELNAKLGKHPLTPLLRERLNVLLGAGFASRTPWAQWARLPVYLRAMSLRVDKYSANPARDMAREADIQELETMWAEKVAGLQRQNLAVSGSLKGFGWDLEELRVSLFAQELKTPKPISVKRLLKEFLNLNQ
ncbi:ATP-dependent RNA helicase HrpA [Alysiella crassa]|uniref:ATP-dependent RNA helicase HrpA n=1 Tax=Alysiella crassa TaxID=153491 RepID=A0A376BLS1_9NEIS|nr:ATP-dependent RNA helicase HrpA [Alysiella crassa]UOP08149.1 ATP-dependent RNA helicase HrpA [Alysiella crassa]SSY70659.1 ATP-dependent RNA helicase HrpA [Alysiella crassa]